MIWGTYRVVPNKRSLQIDTLVNSGGPGEHLQTFSSILAHFRPILAYFEENIRKCWGSVYLSRRVYSALRGTTVISQTDQINAINGSYEKPTDFIVRHHVHERCRLHPIRHDLYVYKGIY